MRSPTTNPDAAADDRDRPGYLMAGDALRALAALAVVAFHAEQAIAYGLGDAFRADPAEISVLADVFAQGSAGVWVFFALSGYLVGGPFVRAWIRGAPAPRAGRYLARRARRIVPAFWVVLVAVMVRFGTYDNDPGEILALFAFGQNLGTADLDGVLPQAWTLGCEVGFYLVLPFIALLVASVPGRVLGPTGRLAVVLAGILLVAAVSLAVRRADDAGPLTLTTAATAWAFTPGLLLAALEDTLRPRLRGRRAGAVAGIALLLAAVGVFAGLVTAGPDTTYFTGEVLRATAGGALVGAALLWQWSTGGAPRVARTRAVHALGRWSYGIYLVHIAVGREALRRLPDSLNGAANGPEKLYVLVTLMIGGSVAAAAVLWWLVEEPALTGRRPSWARARATSPPRSPGAFETAPVVGTVDR